MNDWHALEDTARTRALTDDERCQVSIAVYKALSPDRAPSSYLPTIPVQIEDMWDRIPNYANDLNAVFGLPFKQTFEMEIYGDDDPCDIWINYPGLEIRWLTTPQDVSLWLCFAYLRSTEGK